MPASKVILANGPNPGAAVTSAQTTVTAQHALGFLLVRAEIINATNILLHFVDRGMTDIGLIDTPVLFHASGNSSAIAFSAASSQIATRESSGYWLRQALPLSTTSVLLVFDRSKP